MLPAGNHKGRSYKPFVVTLHLPAVTLQLVGSRAKATLQSHYKGLKAQSTAIVPYNNRCYARLFQIDVLIPTNKYLPHALSIEPHLQLRFIFYIFQ